MRRIREFDADTSVADCLEHLMREHSHIAMVRDRGTIVGMITLEDIIEELVGEIHDEYDRVPAFLTPAGNGWIAGGRQRIVLRDPHQLVTIAETPAEQERQR